MAPAPTTPPTVGDYLTARLADLKLSHRDLARRIPYAPSEVHRWVAGQRAPSVTAIHWLATIFSRDVPEAYGPIAAELVKRTAIQFGADRKERGKRAPRREAAIAQS